MHHDTNRTLGRRIKELRLPKNWTQAELAERTLCARRWEFAYEQRDAASGRTEYMRLEPLSATPIQRHAKIKGEYNPFDPAWERESYMLRTRRMMSSLQYRREVSLLYQQQRGQYAHCRHPITRESGWQDH